MRNFYYSPDDDKLAWQIQHTDPFQAICPVFPATANYFDCSLKCSLAEVAGKIDQFTAILVRTANR